MVAVFFLVTLHHHSKAHPYPLPRGRGTWKGQRTNADGHGQKKEVRESPMQKKRERRCSNMKIPKRLTDILVKVVVAALTAALTAITTTSCMGYGPL